MGDPDEKVILYDFFYKDINRLNSLCAQLFNGNLKDIAATSSQANKSSTNMGGGIPGMVIIIVFIQYVCIKMKIKGQHTKVSLSLGNLTIKIVYNDMLSNCNWCLNILYRRSLFMG